MRTLKIRRLLVVKRDKTKEVPLGLVTLVSIIENVPLESLSLANMKSNSTDNAVKNSL